MQRCCDDHCTCQGGVALSFLMLTTIIVSLPSFLPTHGIIIFHLTMFLQDLPREMIAMICDFADKDALMALRLTDKSISVLATKSFSHRFMTSLSVVMTASCLERLAEICENPSFGPGIRKIYVTPGRIMQHHIETVVSDWTSLVDDVRAQSEGIAKAELMVRRCMDRYRDEQTFRKKGVATELLTRTFTALEAWRHDVELSISPDTRIHHGATFLYPDCYESQYPDATVAFLTNTLQPCLEAIRISKTRLRKLDVSVEGWAFCGGQLDFNLKRFSKEDLNRFSMLRSITFQLEHHINPSTMRAMTFIVSQARKLETLQLSHCSRFFERHIPGRIERSFMQFELGDDTLLSVKSGRIKSLSFTNMLFSKQSLLDFLLRFRDTLESLRFAYCALRDGSWTEIISCMRESLPLLRSLKVDDLSNALRQPSLSSDFEYRRTILGCGKAQITGEKEVQAALQAMIERPLANPLAPENAQDDDEFESDDSADNFEDDVAEYHLEELINDMQPDSSDRPDNRYLDADVNEGFFDAIEDAIEDSEILNGERGSYTEEEQEQELQAIMARIRD
jgi:hypothetical protein